MRCRGHSCLFADQKAQILLDTADPGNAELFDQHLGHVGAEEGRQRGAEVNVVDSQREQGQQHDDGFLLIPGDIVDDRKFIDIINDYYKQEDGGMMRKAIRLSNGLSITDTDVEKKYADYVDDLTAKAEKDGKNRLEKDTGKTVGKQDQNANNNNAADDGDGETANTNNNNKNDDKTTTFEENVCQVDVTLTMYSIERMQDPTEQLSAQNNQ